MLSRGASARRKRSSPTTPMVVGPSRACSRPCEASCVPATPAARSSTVTGACSPRSLPPPPAEGPTVAMGSPMPRSPRCSPVRGAWLGPENALPVEVGRRMWGGRITAPLKSSGCGRSGPRPRPRRFLGTRGLGLLDSRVRLSGDPECGGGALLPCPTHLLSGNFPLRGLGIEQWLGRGQAAHQLRAHSLELLHVQQARPSLPEGLGGDWYQAGMARLQLRESLLQGSDLGAQLPASLGGLCCRVRRWDLRGHVQSSRHFARVHTRPARLLCRVG